MESRTVRVAFYAPGNTRAMLVQVLDDLRSYQGLVGGTIATSPLTEDLLAVYADEGLLAGAAPALVFADATLCGPVFFVRSARGEFDDVTSDDLTTVNGIIANARAIKTTWNVPGARMVSGPDLDSVRAQMAANPIPRATVRAVDLHPAIIPPDEVPT